MRKDTFAEAAYFILIGMICISINAVAASGDPDFLKNGFLTEEEVIQQVRQNNKDLQSAIINIEFAKAQLMAAGLWPNPEAEFSMETDKFYADEGERLYEYGISQTIPISGRTFLQTRAAHLGVKRAKFQVKDFERQLIAQTKKIFYQIIILQKKEKFLRLLVEVNEKLLQAVNARVSQGEVSEIDVSLASGQLLSTKQELSESKAVLYEKKSALNRLMGRRIEEPLIIESSLLVPDFSFLDLKALTQESMENRFDLKVKLLEEQMGESALKLARAMQIPDITLGGFYSREKSRFEVGNELINDDAQFIGIKVSLPLPIFNRNQEKIARAKAEKKQANIQYLGLRLEVEQEVTQAYIRVITSQEILNSYENGIRESVKKSMKLMQDAYAQGQVNFFDVVQTQEKFTAIQKAYLDALQNNKESFIDLEAAVGASLIKTDIQET